MTFQIVIYPLPVGAANYARPCIVIDANFNLMVVSTNRTKSLTFLRFTTTIQIFHKQTFRKPHMSLDRASRAEIMRE